VNGFWAQDTSSCFSALATFLVGLFLAPLPLRIREPVAADYHSIGWNMSRDFLGMFGVHSHPLVHRGLGTGRFDLGSAASAGLSIDEVRFAE
jgi:hypothetical protein